METGRRCFGANYLVRFTLPFAGRWRRLYLFGGKLAHESSGNQAVLALTDNDDCLAQYLKPQAWHSAIVRVMRATICR